METFRAHNESSVTLLPIHSTLWFDPVVEDAERPNTVSRRLLECECGYLEERVTPRLRRLLALTHSIHRSE
jgi:hypothetical protein